MIGFSLFILALILFTNYLPVALLFIALEYARYKSFRENISVNLLEVAHAIDVAGNVLLAPFLNAFFIQSGGYHYGLRGETISSATGKNWALRKLTFLGLGLVGILNRIDENHCWEYIEGDMRETYWILGKPALPGWRYVLFFGAAFGFTFFLNIKIYTWLLEL